MTAFGKSRRSLHTVNFSIRLLARALTIDSRSEDVIWVGMTIVGSIGRYDDAIALGEYGLVHNPLFYGIYNDLGKAYFAAGRFDEAEVIIRRKTLLFRPDHLRLGHALLLQGDAEGALAVFNEVEDPRWRVLGTAMALHTLGRWSEIETRFLELAESWGDQKADDLAQVFAWIGDVDSAFEYLNKWLEFQILGSGEKWIPGRADRSYILHDPRLQNLHSDPRWQPLLEEHGVSDEQLAKIDFEFQLPEQILINNKVD